MTKKHIFIYFILIVYISCSIYSPRSLNLSISVVSVEEDQKGLSNVNIIMVKDDNKREYKTLSDGKINIESTFTPPFILLINPPDKSFLSDTVKILFTDFDKMGFGTKVINIKKRYTTLKGRVVDIETKRPIPLCSVLIEPFEQMVETNREGFFTFISSDFIKGIEYTLSVSRSSVIDSSNKVYSRTSQNIPKQTISLYKINDIGTIEIKSHTKEKGPFIPPPPPPLIRLLKIGVTLDN